MNGDTDTDVIDWIGLLLLLLLLSLINIFPFSPLSIECNSLLDSLNPTPNNNGLKFNPVNKHIIELNKIILT